MDSMYLVGMIFGILSGISFSIGNILQKKAVNDLDTPNRQILEEDDSEQRSCILEESGMEIQENKASNKELMKKLLRSPLWIAGLIISIVFGSTFYLFAEAWVGPSIVPGATAAGLIILVVFSIKLVDEQLQPIEIFGIGIMIFGITLLGLSGLAIPSTEVDFNQMDLIVRFSIYSMFLFVFWLISHLTAKKNNRNKGVFYAISVGLIWTISDLWVFPLVATLGLFFSWTLTFSEGIIFVLSCIILIITNIYGVRQTQIAYRYIQVNKVQPIQESTTQISPILIYFYVVQKPATPISTIMVIIAAILIIGSSFLIMRRNIDYGLK